METKNINLWNSEMEKNRIIKEKIKHDIEELEKMKNELRVVNLNLNVYGNIDLSADLYNAYYDTVKIIDREIKRLKEEVD